ncbi:MULTISPECIES: aspartate aminotransferase family protein [unclassified Bacillus (in: firmicutes)]|uniref:aspartate aminotransferase family protein n=1 Tax=unclassified Bacillus (in: firmicutes) TaxID=185979 RepID=UPI001BE77F78|nr:MULTISPECIES: aspartate aminotransferase family protein [unclassified Bacillus (in: firmicutes)]MBT2618856.1 aspartate aminotransferase family protein [Bacillus sp. ISL-78]MBT2631372.1 aspartate aminotransferase family protein [Bacillus sp. ISL-101]
MERNHLIKPTLDHDYPTISHGNGIYLYDTDGKQYIDGSSGAVTASTGHGVLDIVEAMTEQARKVSFAYRSHFTSGAAEALAKKLSELAPGDLNWSFFVNSGSEATETAMKIAIQHWQEKGFERKNRIISRWTSYHGITMGALSMSGHVPRRKRFVPLLEDFPSISAPYCYRCPHNNETSGCKLKCADELETAIQRVGSENIAAFIAEPIIGASAGAVTPPDGYYQRIKEICETYDILFIADEVMTGIGRTGKMFAMEHWGVTPDIIALGKGMSAGYTPIAATMITDRVMEPILKGSKSIMAGHTYSANPLSAAISLEVLSYIERNDLVRAAEEKGQYLFQKLQGLAKEFDIIGDVRGKGLLLGLEFVSDRVSKKPFDLQIGLTPRLVNKAFAKGLIIYPASGAIEGIAGDAVIISPPLIITNEEIDRLVMILEASLNELRQELHAEGLIEDMQAI